jgi:pimeloyl-ACP methyl ester carboxylesterase
MVRLGFLRLKARATVKSAPVFMLAGGPGGSLIASTTLGLFGPGYLGPLLDTRDVVLLDQRGTEHTRPHLDCPAYRAVSAARFGQGLSEGAETALRRWALERCVRTFRRAGVDLSKYTGVAIAADIDAARRALGYDRIVYYGASYGAQLGQHVMRDFPAMLEAVVLDGASPLSRKSWIEDRALDADHSMRRIADLCRSEPKCKAAYDIPALIERGLALFDAGPIPVSYADPTHRARPMNFDVRRSDFVRMVYEAQGSGFGVSALPYTLRQLVDDGRASMATGMGGFLGQKAFAAVGAPSPSIATVMHLAVVCSDDPVRSVDELVVAGVRNRYAILFGQQIAREYVDNCEVVGVPSLPDSTDVDVSADIPTLILSGGLDAQAPTFRSEAVAKSLRNARLVVFPDATHAQLNGINVCAAKIMMAFVRHPDGPLPLKCLQASQFPGFFLPDGTMSR